MLVALSDLYSISINELLSGNKLNSEEYREQAEKNIVELTKKSAFNLKDTMRYFKKKWLKEHLYEIVIDVIVTIALFVIGVIYDDGFQISAVVAAFVFMEIQHERMNAYAEKCTCGHEENQPAEQK